MTDTKITLHASCSPTIQNTVTIDLMGMKIEGLNLHGSTLLTASMRGDGKHGVTHPCSPIFGPERHGTYGLSQHGPVRNTRASSVPMDEGSAELYAHIAEHAYPGGVVIRQAYKLSRDTFSITTIHENKGKKPAPVNFGEHFYWNSPKGWDGVTLNGQNVTALVQTNGIALLAATNTISIPGQPEIMLEQHGFACAVLWTYRNPETNIYDTNYVCIEPAEQDPASDFFGSNESMIPPGAARSTFLSITLAGDHGMVE